MKHKLIVTHPAPRTGSISVMVEKDDGRALGAWQFRVEVEMPHQSLPSHVHAAAMRAAEPAYNAALNAWFVGGAQQAATPATQATAQKPATPVKLRPPREPGPIFDPEEIMPFVLAARRDAVAIAQVPIRLDLVSDEATASTDCRADVRLNPEPFLRGQIEAGFGRVYHEASHIRYDREAPELLDEAREDGGSLLVSILNLILDRRSDDLNCRDHRGFARAVRRRMGSLLPGAHDKHGVSVEACADVLADFAYACKKRTRPRHKVVHACVRIVRCAIGAVNRRRKPYEELLVAAKQVRRLLLASMPKKEREREERIARFEALMSSLKLRVHGRSSQQAVQQAFRRGLASRLGVERRDVLGNLPQLVAGASSSQSNAPLSGSRRGHGRVVDVESDPVAYAASLARVRHLVPGMRMVLEELSHPVVVYQRGLDHGDLDEDELALLAAGGRDVFMVSDELPELDVAVAFLLDVSSSMDGRTETVDLGTLMNEALVPFETNVDAAFWGFNDDVFQCGSPAANNGIASLKWAGGTDETFGLRMAGEWLLTTQRRCRLLLTACDGGPADPVGVEATCRELLARGVIPVRLLVGVDAAPRTYPVELFFDSFEEVFRELSDFFRSLMLATRS